MPADGMAEQGFAAGLLNPSAAVPQDVSGRTPRRYAVYRNNVTVGLVRAMEANFPAIRQLLGETYFTGLSRAFVQAHPPASPLLFHYGDHFAAFLSAQEDLAQYPYLADVARLEQLWRRAYHAADAKPLAREALAHLGTEDLMTARFRLHPAAALLSSRYAVYAIFSANRGSAGVVAAAARAECVLVTRPRFDVEVRLISLAEYAFLRSLAEKATLAEAAEEGFATNDSFDLAAAIRLMVEAGTFNRVTVQDHP